MDTFEAYEARLDRLKALRNSAYEQLLELQADTDGDWRTDPQKRQASGKARRVFLDTCAEFLEVYKAWLEAPR